MKCQSRLNADRVAAGHRALKATPYRLDGRGTATLADHLGAVSRSPGLRPDNAMRLRQIPDEIRERVFLNYVLHDICRELDATG